VAQECAVDEPKDGILIVFNDVWENMAKARFPTVSTLIPDSLLASGLNPGPLYR